MLELAGGIILRGEGQSAYGKGSEKQFHGPEILRVF